MSRLAFMTAAFLKDEWGEPSNQGFRDRIEASVQTLSETEGFIASDFDQSSVWGEIIAPRIVDRPEFENKGAYTLSLWDDLESVFAYAYNGAHGEALRHRHEWFLKGEWPVHVAWWVDDDHIPTFAEAAQRYDLLHEQGPTPAAFNFQHPFDAHGDPFNIDRGRVREKASKIPLIDWQKGQSATNE